MTPLGTVAEIAGTPAVYLRETRTGACHWYAAGEQARWWVIVG